MDFRMAGSFRQRARNAERTTRQMREHRQRRVGVRTHEAIQEFEEHLRIVQESLNAGIDDLPIDAEAGHLRDHIRRDKGNNQHRDSGSDTSSNGHGARHVFLRSQSEFPGRTGSGSNGYEIDVRYCQRPPSPLSLYDYGSISLRPRSMLAQRSKAAGESMRPAYRQGAPGFYYPGAEFRTGPYGFSMVDPIHMPPRGWEPYKSTPGRWAKDQSDMRPPMTEGCEYRHRRSRTAGPVIPAMVMSSAAHDKRAMLTFQTLDKQTEEIKLEQVRFENGVFEGRWRDPSLDQWVAAAALVPATPACCEFLSKVDSAAPRIQQVASKLLHGVEAALSANKGTLRHLFRSVNRGTPGVLEPEEFLAGVIKLGILEEGELRVEDIIETFAIVDPNFDGRVNFTALERAVVSARDLNRRRIQEAERLAQKHEHKLTSSYSEALPIDLVRVEKLPKSLLDFERSFERFKKQQKELLTHHGELMH